MSDRCRLHEFLCTAKLLKVAKFYSFLLSYSPNQRHDSVPLNSFRQLTEVKQGRVRSNSGWVTSEA